MSPLLQQLVDLQKIETTIAAAKQAIAAHPQRIAEAEGRLNDARHLVEQARQRLKDNQDGRRALEKDAAVFQTRLTKFKDQLASVKTNREYTAMQHEIETAQGELASAEERVIERMVESDGIAGDVHTLEAALKAQQSEFDQEKKAMAAEHAALDASLSDALAARDTLVGALEPRALDLFEQVSKARKGVALCTATRDGLCSVCHVRLRPQVFQLVRQNDQIIQCDSCRRILYYIPPPPPVEHPVVHT